MKIKLVVTLLAATSMAAPAYAASFYVVQNSKTHKCMVASKQPSEKSKTVMLVGDGTAYASKKEASDAIATIDACNAS